MGRGQTLEGLGANGRGLSQVLTLSVFFQKNLEVDEEKDLGCVAFFGTRSYAALRAADLDWIVGPGYSWGRVHSGEKP